MTSPFLVVKRVYRISSNRPGAYLNSKLFIYLSIYVFIYIFIYLRIYLFIYLFIYLLTLFQVDTVKNN